MSILIPNMKMPETCAECPMNYDECWCRVIDGDESSLLDDYTDKRLDKCPLIELPPHGRLIDSDALLENINGIWDCNDMIFEDDNICEKIRADCNSCRWRETRDAIAKMVGRMPTIIETEGVKE